MDQNILDKLAALKNLRDNPGSPGEAAAAAAALQRLLFKHNLRLADVERHEVKEAAREDYTRESFDLGQRQDDTNGNWRKTLMFVLCDVNFCRYIRHGNGRKITIIGRQHNITIVKAMFEYLVREIKRLTIRDWRAAFPDTYGQLNNTATEFSWKRSYREGAVSTVQGRLYAQLREDTVEADTSQTVTNTEGQKVGSGTALVVQSRKEVEDAVTKFFPNLKSGRGYGGGSKDLDAYHTGRKAGKEVNLNKQVGSAPTKRLDK